LSIIVGFSLAWMIASQFDRKSVQTERSELMEADKNEPSSINSPLKMFPSESSQARFGTTVVPPLRQIGVGFAIAKPFNAALLAGVRVAEVLVSLWELLPKMFPSEGSQARFETTDCGSTWFFSRSCSVTILVDVRVVDVLC